MVSEYYCESVSHAIPLIGRIEFPFIPRKKGQLIGYHCICDFRVFDIFFKIFKLGFVFSCSLVGLVLDPDFEDTKSFFLFLCVRVWGF